MSSGAEVRTGKMPVGQIGNVPVLHPDVAPDVAVGDTFLRVRARAEASSTRLTPACCGQSLLNETDLVGPRDFRWNNSQYECRFLHFGHHSCVPGGWRRRRKIHLQWSERESGTKDQRRTQRGKVACLDR